MQMSIVIIMFQRYHQDA